MNKIFHILCFFSDNNVYKMYLAKHRWSKGSYQCGWGQSILCGCFNNDIIDISSNPEVYDLTTDKYEDNPLNYSSEM